MAGFGNTSFSGGGGTSINYAPTGNAQTDISNLSLAEKQARGWTGMGVVAGSDAQALNTQKAQLQQQQIYDPFGYYRPQAAANLGKQMSQEDPSNIFRDKLTGMLDGGFAPDDPSYQWRLDQGQQALERSQGSRGLLNSGNAAIELQEYGHGMASQEYGAQFDRLLKGMMGVEDQYNAQQSRLMDLAGVGIGPSVLSNNMLGVSSLASENAYRSNVDRGIGSSLDNSNDLYAGYSFG
jgi:hypothetical protein